MSQEDKPYEERLLAARQQSFRGNKRSSTLKGPVRVLRFCILGILLPCLICIIVLFMRYRVYTEQMYPLAVSDMRLMDNKVSTTWCQRQLIKVNATFNAFLLPNSPQMEQKTKQLTMVRHLLLEDDTKEYWGFYLLSGSTVTISTCVRWPGASLIVIRGHKHLHECAYIGDNSSEELDELMEAIADGTYVRPNYTDDNAPSNTPQMMKRHRMDVQFHHPGHKNSTKSQEILDGLDETDITDPKQMRAILEQLYKKTKKDQHTENATKKPHAHVHRNSTIGKGETKNFEFKSPDRKATSDEVLQDVLVKLRDLGHKGKDVLGKINDRYFSEGTQNTTDRHVFNVRGRHYSKSPVKYDDAIDKARRRRRDLLLHTVMKSSLNEHDEDNDAAVEEDFTPDGIADDRGTIDENTLNDKSNSEFWSSFSSSEEALLNCAGLILNLPLQPHVSCSNASTPQEIEDAYLANTITYTVPVNGYYFFVFNSENEVQTNYIRVRFNLNKKVYNVSNPVSSCKNTSEFCAMDLNFLSNEKLVMELPVVENEDLWNQEFVVVSQCEPRTMVYIVFVISVPILIMLFAFQ